MSDTKPDVVERDRYFAAVASGDKDRIATFWNDMADLRAANKSLTDQLAEAAASVSLFERANKELMDHVAEERRKFRQETLRTSQQAQLLLRWMARADSLGCRHEQWTKACDTCDLMRETKSLMETPINTDASREADAERLDWLDSLTKRTEFQNARAPARAVFSDMHFANSRVCLFIRDMFGNPVQQGEGATTRAAIDAARGESRARGEG